jgi:hypothetical protein
VNVSDEWKLLSSHRVHVLGLLSVYKAFLMLGGIFVAIGLGMLVLAVTRPQAGTLWIGLGSSAFGLLCLIPLLAGIVRAARWVDLFEEGIAWRDLEGEHERSWPELESVQRLEKLTNRSIRETKLTLTFTDGRHITFNHALSDYDQLASLVQQVSADALLAGKRAELDGGTADFGPVKLRRQGIALADEFFRWDELEHFTVYNGFLVLFPRGASSGGEKSVSLSEVPNYVLLLRLLEGLGHRPAAPEACFPYLRRR